MAGWGGLCGGLAPDHLNCSHLLPGVDWSNGSLGCVLSATLYTVNFQCYITSILLCPSDVYDNC